MTICIIPARKGSKRIKNKNITIFNGKPIIYYAIDLAKKSKLFSRIIVSTDSLKIAKIARKYGAETPFVRSKKLSNHYTTSTEAVIDSIKKISSESEKYHCCIYPTAILTQKKDLVNGYKKIKITKADYLIPVTSYDYSPLRPLEKFGSNWIKLKYSKYKKTRSQDLPELFHDTGTFYFYKTSVLLKNKGNLPLKTTYLMINRIRTIDINEPQDLKIAKLQYNLLKSIKKNGR